MIFSSFYLTFCGLLIWNQPSGRMAVQVFINHYTENNDTHLTCSIIRENSGLIVNIEINVKNKTDDSNNKTTIALFKPGQRAVIHPSSGLYLSGRVTLTNVTQMSTNATLIFHILTCKDEMDYICVYYYFDAAGKVQTKESPSTRILVKTSPSIPDRLSSVIVSSTTIENQGNNHSNFFQGDTVTTINLQSTEKSSVFFREGDTVMFTCSGDIGNPPGKLIWQKTFHQQMKSITYSNESTATVEIAETCSFRGTSNLTIQITAEDLKAKIRCAEESQVYIQGKYVETQPLDVHFHVREVHINKHPNLMQYDRKTDRINLTCTGNGNPELTYEWFKEDNKRNILSRTNLFTIENVIKNSSGVYICEAKNIIDNVHYRNSNSVEIEIVDELPSSQNSDLLKNIVYVIPVVCAVLSIVTCFAVIKYCCIRPKRKGKEESCKRKFSGDGITFNPQYASVMLTNKTTVGELGDTSVGKNDMNDNKSKNRLEDLTKTVDLIPNLQTTSFHSPEYAVPSDALQARNSTCKIPHGMTSFKDYDNI